MSQTTHSANVIPLPLSPRIVPREAHCVSRRDISDSALRVLYRLRSAGFKAMLVGGCVRDLLLGLHPKDFDVATDAHPEQVRELFRNCRLIGRRFRLAHVFFGDHIIEVATFRAHGDAEAEDGDRVIEEGRILRDNVYGDLESDVWRRDFTVNSLYYNIEDFSIVDYAGGMRDIESRTLRLIGDPAERYREDAVRMLRAVRFAAKLGFRIDPAAEAPIFELGHLLRQIPGARLFEEVLKLFFAGCGSAAFDGLIRYGLLQYLFPQEAALIEKEPHGPARRMIDAVMIATDNRLKDGKPVNPAFLFAAFLWHPVQELKREFLGHGHTEIDALHQAADAVISQEVGRVSLPRRISHVMREIWALQPRFERRSGNRAERLTAMPRFRAAYDFLLLRAATGEPVQELAQWWTAFLAAAPEVKAEMQAGVSSAGAAAPARRKRRRPRRRRGGGTAGQASASVSEPDSD